MQTTHTIPFAETSSDEYVGRDGVLSAHAAKRLQQRAIKPAAVSAALQHGEMYFAGDHCTAHFLSNRAVAAAKRALGIRLDCFAGVAVIAAEDGSVVTVEHVKRPRHHWRGND